MSTAAINLVDVDLFYPSSSFRTFSIKEWAFNLARLKKNRSLLHDVHAVRHVSLTVGEGERVGIIGPNGAGKTSLLRAIAGIYPIQSGTIDVSGRVHPLFDLNLGFEDDATGWENIYYRGLLMGESPSVIKAKADEIARFADLGEFIEYPVRSYSAGMRIRLAFAVSTAFAGEVLLLDEVIGAGDAGFFAKAKRRLRELIARASILLLVSHDLESLRGLCNRAICLHQGEIVADGPVEDTVHYYLESITN
ncbi:MAG: ABC transporter ATP-binding protein [Planctomycetes bacterium]|nr:ABC transporter ATP-binding protein [Planctomycetota bacterium]